ncbi:MAG: hypothetical protein AAFR52_03190 [Pseudomonadota bacterium]
MPGPIHSLAPNAVDGLGVPATAKVSPNVRALTATGPVSTVADLVTFPAAVPPFTVLGVWATPNARTLAAGVPTISLGATGACFNVIGIPTSPMTAILGDVRVIAQ